MDRTTSARARGGRGFAAGAPACLLVLPLALGFAGTAQAAASDHSQGNAATSGTYSSPQPLSNADSNGTGANDPATSNPYRSTRNGSASQNGQGGGAAVGRPCAGCVGKADNKNPPGQAPNGSDPNAGYECDRNSGIGRTNPAHTGCSPQPGVVVSPSP